MAQLTDHKIATIGEKMRAGLSTGKIAEAIGMTRNGLSGTIWRLRQAGDTRIPPAGAGATVTKAKQRDALAEAFADGAADFYAAAKQAGLTITSAHQRWKEIRAQLGPQAV